MKKILLPKDMITGVRFAVPKSNCSKNPKTESSIKQLKKQDSHDTRRNRIRSKRSME